MSLIDLQQVSKQLDQQLILQKLTLTIESQSELGLQMTTHESRAFFDLIVGKTLPTSGQINASTQSILTLLATDGLYDQLTVIGYLKQFNRLAGLNLALDSLLTQFSLADVRQQRLKQLTLDQKRRLVLLRAALFQPTLLLIENPLANLSDPGIDLYLQALATVRKLGTTVLITSHYLEDLLLLSTTIYRYHVKNGLEQTDLTPEQTVFDANDSNQVKQPRSIFKVASKLEDKTVFFSPNEIDFIESINGISQLKVGSESFPSPLTMTALEKQLTNFGFFRCHRSYLINLQQIAELHSYSRNSYTLILKSHAKIPLARTKLTDLHDLINF